MGEKGGGRERRPDPTEKMRAFYYYLRRVTDYYMVVLI